MSQAEPKIRIETREELVFLLAEAASIEHNLMCCYLYAAWSLKRGPQDGLTEEQTKIVRGWKRAITSVAVEEMTHLALAGNLATAIGAGPHFSRPNFPIEPGYYPSGVVVQLAGFSRAVLDHFIFLERPEGVELSDSSEFMHPRDFHRVVRKGRLMPSAQDYLTVGHLYRSILDGFRFLCAVHGEKEVFCADPERQIGPGDASLPGICTITDLKSAEAAIATIVEQGEGAPGHSENSHYVRFLKVRDELDRLTAEDPSFAPAFPVARNPVMNFPINNPHARIRIEAHESVRVLDLANSIYGLMLRCLVQTFGRSPGDMDGKRLFIDLAIELMVLLPTIGEHLASMPAGQHHPGVNAGVTFTMLRDVQALPHGLPERRLVRERLMEIADHARNICDGTHDLAEIPGKIAALANRIELPGEGPSVAVAAPVVQPAAPVDVPPRHDKEEIAVGKDVIVHFRARKCIHARHCVLGAPNVFKANTPGTWIFPDNMDADRLISVLNNCPSGALTYETRDPEKAEIAPPVNTVNIRENGPLAFHAPIALRGEPIGFRATLCRCGASKHKPFCDGSHNAIAFKATGEPDTRPSDPLEVRSGPLAIEPQKNGCLKVSGNLEILAGTGRTVQRVTKANFCRCGASHNKPFCDNTHIKIGFVAD